MKLERRLKLQGPLIQKKSTVVDKPRNSKRQRTDGSSFPNTEVLDKWWWFNVLSQARTKTTTHWTTIRCLRSHHRALDDETPTLTSTEGGNSWQTRGQRLRTQNNFLDSLGFQQGAHWLQKIKDTGAYGGRDELLCEYIEHSRHIVLNRSKIFYNTNVLHEWDGDFHCN